MRTRSILGTAALALPLLAACRDSATAPRAHGQRAPAAAVAADGSGDGTELFHVVNSGDVASSSLSSDEGTGAATHVTVLVSRGGTPNDPHTMLFYSVNRCDATAGCAFVEVGSGEIPNGDFRGSGGAVMALVTNTSAASNPSFVRFVGTGGPIALEWRSDGVSSSLSNGVFEVHSGNTSRSEHGSSQSRSALVGGTLVGLALPLAGGTEISSIGTGQQEITIHVR